MKVQFNGIDFEIPPAVEQQLIEQVRGLVADEYLKLPDAFQVMMMLPSRMALTWIERGLREAGQDPMVARPPKRSDPSLHVLNLLVKSRLEERLKDATLHIDLAPDAEGTPAVTSVRFTGGSAVSGGGQMVVSGNIGLRQDDRREAPDVEDALPAAREPSVRA